MRKRRRRRMRRWRRRWRRRRRRGRRANTFIPLAAPPSVSSESRWTNI